MFETFSKEFIGFLASVNIFKVNLPEELMEMFDADTGKGILIKEQVDKTIDSYGICKCGTIQIAKEGKLIDNNCPLCFTSYNPIKNGLKGSSLSFKYKNTKTFKPNKEDCSITVKEGTPIFQLIKNDNEEYDLSLIKIERPKSETIKLSTDGSHLKDFSIYRFIDKLTDKQVFAFVRAMNELVDKKYQIIASKDMISHISNIRHIVMNQMYFETIRTIQQYINTSVPKSYFVIDDKIVPSKENYVVKLEKGAVSLNTKEIDPTKRKIHQIFRLPKVLIDAFFESIRLQDFYLELGKFQIVKKFYDEVSNKDIELTKSFILNEIHYSTNGHFLLNLIKTRHNHDIKSLMRYIIKTSKEEKLNIYTTISSYYDYLNMCDQMELKPIKYPKNLMLVHDVMVKDFKVVQDKASVELFKRTYKELNDDYTHLDMNHVFLQPLSIRALVEEGNQLHHCISSYGNRVIANESLIYFMRKTYDPEIPYVTIEIVNKTVVEARGNFNRKLDKKELKYIKSWAELKSLSFDESLLH